MHPADEPGSITPRTSDEQAGVSATAPSEEQAPRGRIRRMFSRSRELWRVVYRDPEHVAERLTLYTADRLGDPSREWAAVGARALAPIPPLPRSLRSCVRSRRTSRGSTVRSPELPSSLHSCPAT